MSYIFIDKEILVSACKRRLEWAEADRLKAVEIATESFRHTWWRNLLRLGPLTIEQAKKRLMNDYKHGIFGGVLGNINFTYNCRTQRPERLLAACNVATEDKVVLSTGDAEAVNNWGFE
jgi:hypothetical protein